MATEQTKDRQNRKNEDEEVETKKDADEKVVEEQTVDEGEVNEEEYIHEQCEKDKEELTNQLLRLQADFQNYRRRMESQLAQIQITANETLIEELLPILDNLDRALMASKESESSLVSGIRMVYQQLWNCLEKQGLRPIEAVDQEFDPNLHEAISVDGDGGDDLVVTAEVRKGYLFHGKVLRHSMVQVARRQKEEGDE